MISVNIQSTPSLTWKLYSTMTVKQLKSVLKLLSINNIYQRKVPLQFNCFQLYLFYNTTQTSISKLNQNREISFVNQNIKIQQNKCSYFCLQERNNEIECYLRLIEDTLCYCVDISKTFVTSYSKYEELLFLKEKIISYPIVFPSLIMCRESQNGFLFIFKYVPFISFSETTEFTSKLIYQFSLNLPSFITKQNKWKDALGINIDSKVFIRIQKLLQINKKSNNIQNQFQNNSITQKSIYQHIKNHCLQYDIKKDISFFVPINKGFECINEYSNEKSTHKKFNGRNRCSKVISNKLRK